METIQGVRTKLGLVSYSHGAVRVPLAQSFNYTPRISERTLNEFDNLEAVQIVTNYDGIDVSFDYLESDGKLVEAMFADQDPAADVIVDDPSNYKKCYIFANMKGLETGKIFASVIAKACRLKGSPYTEPLKEEAKVTRDLSGTNVLRFKGAAMQYQRILAAVPAITVYRQDTAVNLNGDLLLAAATPFKVTNAKTAINNPYTGNFTVCVLKNGIEVDTGFTMTATEFAVAAAPETTDVWEVYYLFSDV